MNKPKKISGNITLKRIDYNRVIDKVVIKNNETSGKITLPKDTIGKTVYVVWKE